jgi:hypothetical protein
LVKLVRPSPKEVASLVRALYAVASAGGRMMPTPTETASIAAIQRHLLRQDPPLAGIPGPLPHDLEETLGTRELRELAIRLLALLPVIDRRVLPEKVAIVEEAARRLEVGMYGLAILRRASRGQYRRITFMLMKRFLGWWSPAGKARLRDWFGFLWWMLPQLHGRKTKRQHRELLARYQSLATLPPGSFGRALHSFYADHGIPLPGEAKSVPWSMHEVYHVLSEYGVALEAELLLTAFIGGTQGERGLDQMLFGLLSYQAGKQIVGGVVSEGLFDADDYFRAVARGAAINVDLVHGWSLWEVAQVPLPELRARYNLPPISPYERGRVTAYNGLLTGPGHSTPAAA